MLKIKEIELSDNQKNVLIELAKHPNYTRKDLMRVYDGISSDGMQYIIGRLQELGLLRREGGRKNGRWVVMLDIDNENRTVAEVELKRKLEQQKNKEEEA